MTQQAIDLWLAAGMVNGPQEVPRSPLSFHDLKAEWIDDPDQKGYVATITHTMGSASFMFTNLGDGNIAITVTNKTSVGSATGANASVSIGSLNLNPLGQNGSYPRQKSVSGRQPWTNIKQTIRIVKPIEELIK